eukprot:CAMPEP_0115853278 /NCGR_PEP_ID=MMETSP0287-20121206/13422_1 /TAXON_ID=412157 /ORGANISM="Chrysochromulina rotalis, Strain UIO044" /LENGTH=196 /DNA_ID=CAMNT_0003307351 /DNA_START=57 /DNA_END=644 /DNA_ORIENTATION=+
MGKKAFAKAKHLAPPPRSFGGGRSHADVFGHNPFEDPFDPGLNVFTRKDDLLSISVYGLAIMLTTGTTLALTCTLPRLFSHWVWLLFTLFLDALFACRWMAPDVEGWLVFWLLPMLNGLLWLCILLVPTHGVTPAALWLAFGEHGGDHLLIAQLGNVVLLAFPPCALFGFVAWERDYLVAIAHDFLWQLHPGHWKW